MFSQTDFSHMERALALAARGMYTTTPNPRVGCVLVRDGQIIGRGWHQSKWDHPPDPNVEGFPLHASLDARR